MKFEFNREEYKRTYITPGGYIGKIINVLINGEKISVYFDIEHGENKGMFMKEYKSKGGGSTFEASKWNAKGVVNFDFQYSGAKYAFADLLDNIELSNQSFKWNDDTDALKGRLIGVVYRKNVYEDKFGNWREGTDYPELTSIKVINDKSFSIEPKEKKNAPTQSQEMQTYSVSEDDIQF